MTSFHADAEDAVLYELRTLDHKGLSNTPLDEKRLW